MYAIKAIRERLGLTQSELAEGIGCTQGNVGHYERGQTVPPAVAARVIAFCASNGLLITFDHIYGAVKLAPDTSPPAHVATVSPAEV